jgi:hypothetical protein
MDENQSQKIRMAVLLTEVGTLVAAIEETFQTRVPIGDFLALVLKLTFVVIIVSILR